MVIVWPLPNKTAQPKTDLSMRSLFLFLLGMTLAWTGIAQTTYTSLKPSEMVQECKFEGKAFKNTTLFEPSTTKKDVNGTISEYESLTLDIEKLQSLKFEAPEQMSFRIPAGSRNTFELELVKVDIFDGAFSVIESSTNQPVNVDQGIHYRGIIKGDQNSIAAISIYDDEVTGLLSSATLGNVVLAKLNQKNNQRDYILYNDEDVVEQLGSYCETPDDGPGYTREQLDYEPSSDRGPGDCVRIYFEVDHDIFNDKGGTTGATNYITAIFNQAATLYANENVSLVISQVYVWDTPSPYSGTSSGQMLTQFQSYRTNFNGDLAQLVSYQASGGIAVLNGLCHPYVAARMSFASVGTSFATVPTYSFTVMVMAHELGHLLGSHHTHACVWNGNNTAIDGCAGFTEGSCSNPGYPSGGGTIMSYCHITSAGIDFNLGFGIQPGNVIRYNIDNAVCTQPCSSGGGGGSGGGGDNPVTCSDNEIFITIVLDDYGSENTWDIKNGAGTILAEGGPFPKASAGLIVRDTVCLPDGCYNFTMYDSYGDGMCCDYGSGSYAVKDGNGNIFAEGGAFLDSELTGFCAPYQEGGNEDCLEIDFNDFTIDSYGGSQDAGNFQLLSSNTILKLENNAWKSIALEYTVTENTMVEFEFRSTIEGEIHAIGFDNNSTISYNRTFKVHGSQSWGYMNFDTYSGNGGWQYFAIPIGQFYTGDFDRFFFVADHDSGQHNGNSYFRNVKIHEGNGCGSGIQEGGENDVLPEVGDVRLFPNPASDQLQMNFFSKSEDQYTLNIFNMMGQLVKQVNVETSPGKNNLQINVSELPQGTYLLKMGEENVVISERLVITRS
ncbi:MAG: T9SS C-terminal target domain-containing protein [Bacteroidetes bacterium]|nr:MAG: T9SS C-terminal target domain-containing protein [Bacteroidota bacterium]